MLENKVIIYDDSCPMCKLYTWWFVAWGFLRPENRIGFAAAPDDIVGNVDLDRGRHEIPLFDRSTHETIYGLNALTFVLESRWSWLKPFFKSKLFLWMFYPLYQIITYNRRVIAGCKPCCGFDCAPDLNRFYRSVYMVLASGAIGLVAALLVFAETKISTAGLGVIVAFATAGFLTGMVARIEHGSLAAWNHAGNFATTVLIVALVLVPSLIWPAVSESLNWANLGVALLIGLEEIRRRELITGK